jgi:AAA+ ATPase superfamily predicted ATPase
MIGSYNDFIEALFEIDVQRRRKKVIIKELISEITRFSGIPISKDLLDMFFKEDKPKNAFRYIVEVFKDIRSTGKIPILILDELQKIGDVKIDNYLIYELFNLFIRLTKELHTANVFAITSDSLFIERVYSEAMLQGRCRYLLVDDFDYETTVSFLKRYGFSEREAELVWEFFGGKPVYLVEAVKVKRARGNLEEFCRSALETRASQIAFLLDTLKIIKGDVEFRGEKIPVDYKRLLELLREVSETMKLKLSPELIFLVRENILFIDPVRGTVKPQSKLDLLAIKKVLKELET